MKYLTCFITLSFPVLPRVGQNLSYVSNNHSFVSYILSEMFIHSFLWLYHVFNLASFALLWIKRSLASF